MTFFFLGCSSQTCDWQLVHGGLLGVRGNEKHEGEMKHHNIPPIDLVVVNLYPFQATVEKVSGFCVDEPQRSRVADVGSCP